jgi:ABC-2 type transport system ATP-binding protein
MIKIKDLEKRYHGRLALNIKELSIEKGAFWGIVGNNGAGKTTLLRLLLDLIPPDKGEISSGDSPVFKSEDWKSYTSSYLDDGFLLDFLTPEEFFYFVGNCYGFSQSIIDKKLSDYHHFFKDEILGKKKKYIRDFSKGNRQKIGICSALITEPSILVLDEPFNGLDPTSQLILNRTLTEYNRATGATIILSSHDLNHVTELATRITIIENGCIVRDMRNTEGALAELQKYFSVENTNSLF